jgi:uncharacterized protein YndB with AHSA1/START domain
MSMPWFRAWVTLLLVAATCSVRAEIKAASSDGFVVVYSQRINAAPATVFAALTAVDRWWSSEHTWSGNAANLSLKAEAGGCFCERWKDGNVEHGRVIMVLRDQMLRLQSALGPLQAGAVNGVLTFQLAPDAKSLSAATVLTLTYAVNAASGSALDKIAPAVNSVLGEQFGRLVRFIETGQATAP